MYRVRVHESPEACEALWNALWPRRCLFDLWPVRSCFARAFDRPNVFVTAYEDGRPVGLLPLTWIEEEGYWGHFPGETWKKKTWLEQNRIIAPTGEVLDAMLSSVTGALRVRYLLGGAPSDESMSLDVDEVGFVLFPREYGYRFDRYEEEFSGKSRKRLGRELERLSALGVTVKQEKVSDLDILFQMNLDAFGPNSYFADSRFLQGFERMCGWLAQHDMLRVTTVFLGGTIAAVDVGAVYDNTYTVLAGGTVSEFPGVAKLINLEHIKTALSQRYDVVDFLCGDFGWKKRFHLRERPLYVLEKTPAVQISCHSEELQALGCAV